MSISPIGYDKKIIFRMIPDVNYIYNNPYAKLRIVDFTKAKITGDGIDTGSGIQIDLPIMDKISISRTFRFKVKFSTFIPSRLVYLMADSSASRNIAIDSTGAFSNNGTIYVNGVVFSGNLQINTWYDIVVVNPSNNGFISNYIRLLYADGNNIFKGVFSLVEIYKGALTASEVANLYQGNRYKEFNDISEIFDMNINTGRIFDKFNNTISIGTGMSAFPQIIKYKKGKVLNVKNAVVTSILNVNNFPLSSMSTYSICIWNKFGSTGTGNSTSIITSYGQDYDVLQYYQPTGVMRYTRDTFNHAASCPFKPKDMDHFVLVVNNNVASMFVNGASQTVTSPTLTKGTSYTNISIFGARNGYNFLSRVRIFSKALSAAEVSEIYTSEKVMYE